MQEEGLMRNTKKGYGLLVKDKRVERVQNHGERNAKKQAVFPQGKYADRVESCREYGTRAPTCILTKKTFVTEQI